MSIFRYCALSLRDIDFWQQFTEHKEQMEKQQAYEKREFAKFRSFCEERVNRYIKDEKRKSLQFQTLNRFYRSIV